MARRAAGDSKAKLIADVCDAAGVTIVRTNMVASKMKPGQTNAVIRIEKCVEQYGKDVMIATLRCLTKTADGNAGFLRATIIEAIAEVLNKHPDWMGNEAVLHRAFQSWSWPDVWGQIVGDQPKVFPHTALTTLVNRLEKFLNKRFEQISRKKAA